jgi:hypothetical protein
LFDEIRPKSETDIIILVAQWPALDELKAFCVVGMILAHGFFWVWTDEGRLLFPLDSVYVDIFRGMMFLGLFPLTLPLLAGATYGLRMASTPGLSFAVLAQCVVLAALGYLMNVMAAGAYAFWAWNVLQFVALSFILIALLHGPWGLWPVTVFAVLVLGVSDQLRDLFPAEERNCIMRVLLGDPDDWHTWPFFPWFSLVAAGYVVSNAYQRRGGDSVFCIACAAVGIGLTLVAAYSDHLLPEFDPENLIGPRVMQPPAAFVLGLLGIVLIVIALLTKLQQRLRLAQNDVVRCFSAGILWIYLVHITAGLRGSRLLFSLFDRQALMAEPWSGWHPLLLWGFLALLLLLSWAVGYFALHYTHSKRLRIRVRKI